MITMTLYRKSGAYSYSPTQGTGATASGLVRLVADSGRALTNGIDMVAAIDVAQGDVGLWTEVDAVPDEMGIERTISEIEALL